MKIIKSKILNDYIVVAENRDELEEAEQKAEEMDCALYTSREIEYVTDEIFDMDGRRLHLEGYPQLNGEGLYSLDLGLLEPGIRIIRFRYTDQTMETIRIRVE